MMDRIDENNEEAILMALGFVITTLSLAVFFNLATQILSLYGHYQ